MEATKCLEILLSRRSIRRFKPDPVPLDLVMKAIEVARYAPSAKNLQPWRFIVITKRELLDKLATIHVGAKPLREAKLAVLVASVPDVNPVSHLVDAALAALYLWLALHCLGLGAVWIQTLRNVDEIKEILQLPPNLYPVAILAIGWPAEKPEPPPRRKLSDIVKII